MKQCSVPSCSKEVHAKGLCNYHYQRKRLEAVPAVFCKMCGTEISSRGRSGCCQSCSHRHPVLARRCECPVPVVDLRDGGDGCVTCGRLTGRVGLEAIAA